MSNHRATSTRIVASMWWFFTLIMISSYTANLAAFLTVENPASTIESVDDLVAGKVPYGSKNPGATYSFFQYSTNEKYKQMYDYMSQNPELMTSTNDAGVAKASAGRYAFLMESSTIEYTTQRNCDVVQVGNKLDEKGYGIAMKKGKFHALQEFLTRHITFKTGCFVVKYSTLQLSLISASI